MVCLQMVPTKIEYFKTFENQTNTFCFRMALEYQTINQPNSFGPFEFQTHTEFA